MAELRFARTARAEARDAESWYRALSGPLADGFVAELGAAAARIVENPLQFPVMFGDIRRARLRRFPYALFYRLDGETVYVVACFHGSRDPRRWQSRPL